MFYVIANMLFFLASMFYDRANMLFFLANMFYLSC